MGLLNRAILRELFSNAFLGTVLFTFVLFLQRAGKSFDDELKDWELPRS